MKGSPFEFGMRLASAGAGVSRDEMLMTIGEESAFREEHAATYKRELCKMAVAAFQAGDAGDSVEAHLFDNLSKQAYWSPAYDRFTACVLRAMARVDAEEDATAHQDMDKSAFPIIAGALHEKSGIPSMLKTLLSVGAVGGVSTGALAFLLNRNARQSSADSNKILQRVRTYNQLRKEIEEDMTASGAMDSPATQEDDQLKNKYEL